MQAQILIYNNDDSLAESLNGVYLGKQRWQITPKLNINIFRLHENLPMKKCGIEVRIGEIVKGTIINVQLINMDSLEITVETLLAKRLNEIAT